MFCCCLCIFFFFKQKTAYEMRISDWSSDVCSSDLHTAEGVTVETEAGAVAAGAAIVTVSTSVLAAEAILFDPPLSAEKRAALAAIPLGRANKLALAFDGDPFGGLNTVSIRLAEATADTLLLQIRPFGRDLVTGFLGGRFAEAVEQAGEAATG